MRQFYVFIFTCLFSIFLTEAQTLGVDTFNLGNDNADNYGGTWNSTNQGTGFSDWTFDETTPGGSFTGRFIASFSTALDVNGNSFGLFANSANGAVSGAATTFPKSLEEGDTFTVSIGVNFRDGAKGFDLRDASNATIINFNVSNDQYRFNASTDLFGNTYDANTVITFTFTQNTNDVSWTAVRSGGLTGSESGTVSGINPDTITNIRFYNVSAGTNNDGGSGQRNLFLNSLIFESLYTIANNSTITPSIDLTIPYLNIRSGCTVIIPSLVGITVTRYLNNQGTLRVQSTSTRFGSLIVNGSANGDVIYRRYVNASSNGNDLIAPPVDDEEWSDFLTSGSNAADLLDDGNTSPTEYAFAPFDKVAGDYQNFTDGTSTILKTGVGYRVATDAGTTLDFTGSVETGQVTNDISNSGPAFEEWNLVGNPYTSYINVQDFLNTEVTAGVTNLNLFDSGAAAIYGYDGDASNGWTVWNLATTTSTDLIAPGQGFFVSADATNAGLYDLTFVPEIREVGASDDFIPGRSASLINLELELSSATNNYVTDFYFDSNATAGLDPGYDAAIFGNNAPAFAIYSELVQDNVGDPLAVQALGPNDYENITIALGVNANQGEQITFSITENTLPAGTEVYLDDTVASTSTLLTTSDYILTPSTALSGTGRFFIRFVGSALNTFSNELDSLNIYTQNKQIHLSGLLKAKTVASVYDIQGRLVLLQSLQVNQMQQVISANSLSSGIYILDLSDTLSSLTQKIVIP